MGTWDPKKGMESLQISNAFTHADMWTYLDSFKFHYILNMDASMVGQPLGVGGWVDRVGGCACMCEGCPIHVCMCTCMYAHTHAC